MKILQNKKIQIAIGCILVVILVGISIFFFSRKENQKEKNHIKTEYTMLVEINPSVKLTFEESYDECIDQDGKKSICSTKEQIVTSYELINDDAKKVYKDVDFKGKDIYEAIAILCDTVKDNGIKFESFEITSDWKSIPNEEEFLKKVKEHSKYKEKLTVTIKQDDAIKDYNPEVKMYDVIFDSDGGTKIKTQVIKEHKKVTKPENPTKKGYVFVEWQLNKKTYDFEEEVTKDITLKAKWEKEPTTQTSGENNKPSNGNSDTNNTGNTTSPENDIQYPAGSATCIDRPDSFECKLEQAEAGISAEHKNTKDGFILKVFRYNKELYTVTVKSLNRCYESYCGGWEGVRTFSVNEQNIKNIPKEYRKLLYEHYGVASVDINGIKAEAQKSYDKVVSKKYVEIQTKKVVELKTLLEKYKDYKDQERLPDEDCTTTSFGRYYDSYAMLESLYQEESLLLTKSQDDLNTVTEALKQAKIIDSAFQS